MNNYSSPLIIRILNTLDILFGLGVIYIVIVCGALIEPNIYSPFIFVACLICIIYALICITKSITYVMCIFQGYRVTPLGMIMYIIWTVLVSICTAVFIVSIIIANIRLVV